MRKIMFALACLMFGAVRAEATVQIHIDLSTETMSVTSGSGASYEWPVSTARAGYITPRGTFRPQALMAVAFSRKYHNSPMPHSIFFRGGYAIHGSYEVGSLGHPASHGCVRLAPANAATLFSLVQREGALITISGGSQGGGYVAQAGHHHHKTLVASAKHHHHGGTQVASASGHHHHHHHTVLLAYAPQHHTPSLNVWLHSPTGR
jgi:hypothetical protein